MSSVFYQYYLSTGYLITFDGILVSVYKACATYYYSLLFISILKGLSPIDESAGPLLVTYLNQQGLLDSFKFSLFLSPNSSLKNSSMLLGSYEDTYIRDKPNNSTNDNGGVISIASTVVNPTSQKQKIIAHSVSGSFHWQVHVVNLRMNGEDFRPTKPNALTDSGTTATYLTRDEYTFFYQQL